MISDFNTATLTSNSRLFFDANVWLSIFAPPSNPIGFWQQSCARMLKKAKRATADLFIDSTVVSEYLNSYVRVEYNKCHAKTWNTLKAFREGDMTQYRGIVAQAIKNVKEILTLPQMVVVDCPASKMDLQAMLTSFASKSADWNDCVIAEICKISGFTLVTNDRDFEDVAGLSILTANNKLLSKASNNS